MVSPLRINAVISGVGPTFRIRFNVENLTENPLLNLGVTYDYDFSIFKMKKPCFFIPCLVPKISYPFEIEVLNIDPNGSGDIIRIYISEKTKSTPLICAQINMPMSELAVD